MTTTTALRGFAFTEALRLRSRASVVPWRGSGTVKFSSMSGGQEEMENNKEKEKEKKQQLKKNGAFESEDLITQSFGEAYATRCEEEGFGGVYGGNPSLPGDDIEPERVVLVHQHVINEEYDKTQGTGVAEKERARNRPTIE